MTMVPTNSVSSNTGNRRDQSSNLVERDRRLRVGLGCKNKILKCLNVRPSAEHERGMSKACQIVQDSNAAKDDTTETKAETVKPRHRSKEG
jgi:hypothetical protein